MAKAPAPKGGAKAKGKADEVEAPDVERHDEIFFRHPKGAKVGRVLSRGEHGCWVESEGSRHPVRWADYHGHKTKVRPEVKVVDQGDDGLLVEDRAGRRRFVADALGLEPGPQPVGTMAKSLMPVVLIVGAAPADLAKAMGGGRKVANGAGLSLQNVTDRAGHQTKRWKRTGADQKAAPHTPHGEDQAQPKHGLHNVHPGHEVSFKMGTLAGKGEVTTRGEDGATVKDAEGHEHKIEWKHVTDAKAGGGEGGGKKPPKGRDPGHVEGSAFDDLPPAGVEALVNEVNQAVKAAKMADLFAGPETDALPEKAVGKLTSWDAITARQEEAQAGLQKLLDGVGAAMGGRDVGHLNDESLAGDGIVYGLGPPKEKVSAERKVADKYGGDWSRLSDAVRASIGFDTVDQLREGIEKLKAAGLKLASKPDNKFVSPTNAGYRDMNLNFEMPNGVVGELQLHLKPILRAKSEGHKHYDVTRILDAKAKNDPPLTPSEDQELKDRLMKQRVLYTRAMQGALKSKG